MKRTYHVTYDIVTPESAEDGDYAESGWIDAHGWKCNTDAVGQAYIDWCKTQDLDHVIEPDEYDIEEYGGESEAAVALMVRVLRDAVAYEHSCSSFDGGGSYYVYDEMDMYDGSTESRAYHFEDGWTDEEKRAIFDTIRSKR